MNQSLTEKYPHLSFQRIWNLDSEIWFLLGECKAYVKSICHAPILPKDSNELHEVALIKGAVATTAIEGNTLTEDEIQEILNGRKISESREYQFQEVNNVLIAFTSLVKEEIVNGEERRPISPDFIKRLHKLIGSDLGEHLDAIPGKYRESNVIVGSYRAPDYPDVPQLVQAMCDWLIDEFKYPSGKQRFQDVVIQALVAHIYLEWIHPFGDGNGRTGRLLEFYILLRGGLPSITLHLLSNHFNMTRSQYYKEIHNAFLKQDLTGFIKYALKGMRDGLIEDMRTIQSSQLVNSWHKLIYDEFDKIKIGNRETFKRKRTLMIQMPLNKKYTIDDLSLATPLIAKLYGNISQKSLSRDLSELVNMGLMIKNGKTYSANTDKVKAFLVVRKDREL